MRVCVIRNAEAASNASMLRVVDALLYGGYEVILLTRNREKSNTKQQIFKKNFIYNGRNIENYEIQLPALRGNGTKNLLNLYKYINQIFLWLKNNNEKYDYIHSFDLDTGIPALLASIYYKKNLIYHIADFYVDSREGIPQLLKFAVKKMEYMVINRSNLTIVCTEERKQQIKGSNPNKLTVIHNTPINTLNNEAPKYKGDHPEIFKPLKDNRLKICYVGGFSKTRFIEELLKVVSSDSRLFLDIAGYGTLSELVSEYGKKFDNIKFHGAVDYSKSLELNANSDLMIAMYDPKLKNHKFSAPNKVYEAMNFGKPIIVAKDTSVDELVFNEEIGFISEYHRASFKKIIDKIFKNPDLLFIYSKNAKQSYQKYSWEKMRNRLISEYKKLL